MTQCTARSKRSKLQCQRDAVPGRTVCAMHGGHSLIGPAHPNYKSGRYSKLLPGGLAMNYEKGRRDPELLALRDEIALTNARLIEAAKKADWQEADKLIEQRRKLVESEQKRLVAMQQMLSAEEAHVLIAALIRAVTAHVSDRKQLAAIGADMAAIVGRVDHIQDSSEVQP